MSKFVLLIFAALFWGNSIGANVTIAERRETVLSVIGTTGLVDRQAKVGPYEVLAWAAKNGCPRVEDINYLIGLTNNKIEDNGYDVFLLPPLVRFIYTFGYCLSDKQRQLIGKNLEKPQALLSHGTTNHAIIKATSWYLLAQYYKNNVWTDLSGSKYSSEELMKMLKGRLLARTRSFFEVGENEQFSPTYAMPNLFCMLNLFDFSLDKELKENSSAEANLIFALLSINSFHGRLVPPLTRAHAEQLGIGLKSPQKYFPAISQHILWYYLGEPVLGNNDFVNMVEPPFVVMLVMSSWNPLPQILNMKMEAKTPYQVNSKVPGFAIWDEKTDTEVIGSTYFDKRFAVGGGNLIFEPLGYNDAFNMFGIVVENGGLVDCYNPYWKSNKGESDWSYDRSSPFQEFSIAKNRGLLIFDIPQKDPFVTTDSKNRFFSLRNLHADALLKVAKCRFPTNVKSVVMRDGGIYIDFGNVYVGLRSNGADLEKGEDDRSGVVDFHTVKFVGSRFAIYFRVEDANVWKSFGDFRKTMEEDYFKYLDGNAFFHAADDSLVKVSFSLNTFDGKKMRAIPDISGKAFGAQNGEGVIDSPFFELAGGHLKVFSKGKVVLDLFPQPISN